jgi:LPS sulfotransferase NodH
MAYRRVIERIWNRVTGHRNYRFFVVICHARTGSNLLYSYINAHPNVEMHGEIFKQLDGRDIHQVFQTFSAFKPKSIHAAGFKMFYTHPEDGDPESLLRLIESKPDPLIIHLTRQNRLRTFISLKIAERTHVWGLKDHQSLIPVPEKMVYVDPREFEKFVLQLETHERNVLQRFGTGKYLAFTYEELTTGPEKCLQQIFNKMNVSYIPPKTRFRKSNPEPLHELIQNFEQIKHLHVFQPYILE